MVTKAFITEEDITQWILNAYTDAMAEWYTSEDGWDDDSYDVESDD